MFPMNFNMQVGQQYQQTYDGESADVCGMYENGGGFYEQNGKEEKGKSNGKKSNQ